MFHHIFALKHSGKIVLFGKKTKTLRLKSNSYKKQTAVAVETIRRVVYRPCQTCEAQDS